MKSYDLEDRLIDFACEAIKVSKSIPYDPATRHLGGQLIRSSASSALNYGEAQSAESRKDFIHKVKVVLKELRESRINVRILSRSAYLKNDDPILKEANELIAIFAKSLITAKKNQPKKGRPNSKNQQ